MGHQNERPHFDGLAMLQFAMTLSAFIAGALDIRADQRVHAVVARSGYWLAAERSHPLYAGQTPQARCGIIVR